MNKDHESRIARSMVIRGDVECNGPVLVEGRLEGSFRGQDLEIAHGGVVSGRIGATRIECSGNLEGEIAASSLTLRKNGCHRGTVTTESLVVEPGAVLDCALQSGKRIDGSSKGVQDTTEPSIVLDLEPWLAVFDGKGSVNCMDVPWSERALLFQNVGELLAKSKPLIKICGEEGSGKSGFVHRLKAELPPEYFCISLTDKLDSVTDILSRVVEGLVEAPSSNRDQKALLDEIETKIAALQKEGRRVVLIADDVHEMFPASIEGMIRLLTSSFEERQNVLQIILLGTGDMDELLVETIVEYFEDETNCQLDLMPLSVKDCAEYLRFCLQSSKMEDSLALQLFPYETIKYIHSRSAGNLATINDLATKGLLRAHQSHSSTISPSMLN